jgi:hypothetical protein
MSTGREGFRSRSASSRRVSTALIISAIRTNLTGKAVRYRNAAADGHFWPPNDQSMAQASVSQKFGAQEEYVHFYTLQMPFQETVKVTPTSDTGGDFGTAMPGSVSPSEVML